MLYLVTRFSFHTKMSREEANRFAIRAAAKAYEDLKVSLAAQAPVDSGREKYLKGKHDFIVYMLRKALVHSYLGKTVEIKIDRPVGSTHPRHENFTYPINCGYIPNVTDGDGEVLDVYLLGVEVPVKEYKARMIGMIHHRNNAKDKLVAAPEGMDFTKEKIAEAVHFQEQYYENEIELWETINESAVCHSLSKEAHK